MDPQTETSRLAIEERRRRMQEMLRQMRENEENSRADNLGNLGSHLPILRAMVLCILFEMGPPPGVTFRRTLFLRTRAERLSSPEWAAWLDGPAEPRREHNRRLLHVLRFEGIKMSRALWNSDERWVMKREHIKVPPSEWYRGCAEMKCLDDDSFVYTNTSRPAEEQQDDDDTSSSEN